MDANDAVFLAKKMRELREKNGCSQEQMAEKLNMGNKSSISRIESGKIMHKNLVEYAKLYCKEFGLSEDQTTHFLRGEKIAIPDTSALLKNPQLIDQLSKEYAKVIIPNIVIDELDSIKNKKAGALAKKAWEVIRGIGYNERTLTKDYLGEDKNINNDCKIIDVAKKAFEEFNCSVDIITEDTDYSAYLKGYETVNALYLREYMATKQEIVNMSYLSKIDSYYGENYESLGKPTTEEVNAYLPNGFTLIISTIRNNKYSFEEKKAKIKWLLSFGANINKRDFSRRYFPPITHAIQCNDYNIFSFLLKECKADPNVGSRNPHSSQKLRQKNEGNMPLMVAAYHGKYDFVKTLCEDDRTSLNQQDSNGFTALIKACLNGHAKCRDILVEAGADQRIVDLDGKSAEDWWNTFLEKGPIASRRRNNGR